MFKNLSDEKLMLELRKGKKPALEELYDRYYDSAGSFFMRYFNNDGELARDMAQELFLKLMLKSHTFKAGYRFSPWFFSIAYNLCKNHFRKTQTEKRYNSSFTRNEIEPVFETKLEQGELYRILFEQLSTLKEIHRELIEQKYFMGNTIPEIARNLGINEGTAKSRLFHALKHLSKKMKQQIDD